MDAKTIAVALVCVMVGAVMFGALIPVFGDVTATEDTFKNTGYFTYDPVTDDTDIVIIWDPATPKTFAVGDKTITMPDGATNLTIVGSANFTCRYYSNTTTTGIQTYGVGGYKSYNLDNETAPVTVTVTASSLAFDGALDKTYTMGEHGFIINVDGDGPLTLKYPTESAYVLEDSEIYLCGTTFVTGSGTNDFVGVFGWGTFDDITLSCFYGNTGGNTVSYGDPVVTYQTVNGYEDLYKLTKYDFTITQNGASVDATYSYFVVPTEVTAERSVHPDESMGVILDIIPLVIGVGLLLLTVAWFLGRKF